MCVAGNECQYTYLQSPGNFGSDNFVLPTDAGSWLDSEADGLGGIGMKKQMVIIFGLLRHKCIVSSACRFRKSQCCRVNLEGEHKNYEDLCGIRVQNYLPFTS